MRISSPSITGVITKLQVPSTLKVGSKIEAKLDGDLCNPDFGWYDFWSGCLTVERTGYRNHALFGGNGECIGPDPAPTILVGFMPDYPVTLEVKLYGNPDYWVSWNWSAAGWILADARTVTIEPSGGGAECASDADCGKFGPDYRCVDGVCVDEGGNPPPVKGKFPWNWVALGGGALVAAIILSRR